MKESNSTEKEICPNCRHLDGLLCLKTRILFKKSESFLSECNYFESLMNPSIPHKSDSSEIDVISIDADVVEFEELTPSEEEERRQLEEIVERSFVEAGRALKRLRDGRFYRSTHPNFESYVRDRFAMRQSRSYQLIDAAEVFKNLSSKVPQFVELLPTNEAQCRPLTKLSSDEQLKAWQQAVSEAGEGKVPPARVVKSVVDRIREKNPAPNPWRVGEIAEIIVKGNPDLYGRGGCWCIITEVHSFSCTIQMWDRKIQVKISNLKTLDLFPDQQKEIRHLCDRLNRLAEISELDRSARVLLASLGRQTFLTPIEEQLLRTLESYYLKLNQ
jgi:hypothetical protein